MHEDEARKSYGEHLDDIKSDVIRLAAMVGEQIGAGTQALLDADLGVAQQVIESGHRQGELGHSIEIRTYELFATQQPMAVDLRTLLTVLRTLQELDLAGNLMVSIAKAARRLYPAQLPPKVRGLLEGMGAQASVQMHLAIDAFADRDNALALSLPDIDDVSDDLQKELFRAIFSSFTPDETGLQQAVQIALVGRYYERVADHAVQIGRWVNFMVTGELPGYEPPQSADGAA
jgi:phosphate transport system protein